MAMAEKRAIARKRVIASHDNNDSMATETMTTTTTTITMTLTMMTKTMMKTATTTVQRRWLAMAGSTGGGQ